MRLIRDLSFYHLQEPKWVCQSNFVDIESGHSPGNHILLLSPKSSFNPRCSSFSSFLAKYFPPPQFSLAPSQSCWLVCLSISITVLNTLDKKRDGRGSVAIENCFGPTFFFIESDFQATLLLFLSPSMFSLSFPLFSLSSVY